MIQAEIVADSLSINGDRLISVLCTFPRIILAEVNTHRMLSKNTSSSRAIPFHKMVEAVNNDPFIPIAWQKEHKGMQGNEYFDTHYSQTNDYNQDIHYGFWMDARDEAIRMATCLHDEGLTKQLCNRLLEPFMWTTMLITGSKEGWDNFFNLRCPQYSFGSNTNDPKTWKSKKDAIKDFPDWVSRNDFYWNTINKGQAEIHMMALAEEIYDAMNESIPMQLQAGEWHIPFKDKIEYNHAKLIGSELWDNNKETFIQFVDRQAVKVSTAMAAHTSYTIVGNKKEINYKKMIELHDRLIAQNPPHSSPMEHCARAMNDDEYMEFIKGKTFVNSYEHLEDSMDMSIFIDNKNLGWCYNLKGFISYRYLLDTNNKI